MEKARLKMGIKTFLVVGLTAVVFIVVAKVLVNKYNIPGKELINAV